MRSTKAPNLYRRVAGLLVVAMAALGLADLALSPASAGTPAQSSPTGMHLPLPSFASASQSPDWIPTPEGLAYASCHYQVPEGGSVDADGNIVVNGVVTVVVPQCPYDGVVPDPAAQGSQAGTTSTVDPSDTTSPPEPSGWWVDSSWTKPSGWLSRLDATWTVPGRPASYASNSVVYLFPSLEDPTKTAIIQPVLQFGNSPACNSGQWELAGWFVAGGTSYEAHSTCLDSPAGDTIIGTIISSGCESTGHDCRWSIQAEDLSTAKVTTLLVDTSQVWTSAQGGVLETYNLGNCSYLPASGSTVFTGIKVYAGNGSQVTPNFAFEHRVSNCQANGSTTSTKTTLTWNP